MVAATTANAEGGSGPGCPATAGRRLAAAPARAGGPLTGTSFPVVAATTGI
jgi:hypothetical protein